MVRFILDTNFISELRKPQPNKGCRIWVARAGIETMYLTTITIAEIAQGVEQCETESRKAEYRAWLEGHILHPFANRIFDFDRTSALIYGAWAGRLRREGCPRPILDLQIAAIALAHECTIVSRNRRDFEDLGVPVLSPWTSG